MTLQRASAYRATRLRENVAAFEAAVVHREQEAARELAGAVFMVLHDAKYVTHRDTLDAIEAIVKPLVESEVSAMTKREMIARLRILAADLEASTSRYDYGWEAGARSASQSAAIRIMDVLNNVNEKTGWSTGKPESAKVVDEARLAK